MGRKGDGTLVVLAEYNSESSPGVKHQVRIGGDGVLYCTCHAGIRHLRGTCKECWHMESWKSQHPNWPTIVRLAKEA